MKQIFHKTLAFVMAFVVLLSTMSFTVSMHYCGDTLVETAMFQEAKGCGMELQKPSSTDCSFTKKSCCNDIQLTIDGQDEVLTHKISFEQQVFIASFLYTYRNLFEGIDNKVSSYEPYRSPLVVRQLYKLDETYLI